MSGFLGLPTDVPIPKFQNTSQRNRFGSRNFSQDEIRAFQSLFYQKNGCGCSSLSSRKIKKIIVSGEKSKGYNEPAAMKNYLIYQEGVPEDIIIEDPKGFNTYKSILRCKDVYKRKMSSLYRRVS
jgi:vancomycin permeability regulator SanA